MARLPFSLKILLENLLRNEDGEAVRAADIEALAKWNAKAEPSEEIAFTPARVLLQDFTGVPAIVDLAAMRDAMQRDGRRSEEDQPAGAGRAGDRPLGPGRRVRHTRRRSSATPSSSSSATTSATRSCAGARPRSTTSRSCRPTPASSTRSTSSTWRASCSSTIRIASARRLPGHAGRHRLAHDDDQRPRRARLGRRRHRGRGGDARPAGVDADPAGGRLQARRASCPRARPRPTSC